MINDRAAGMVELGVAYLEAKQPREAIDCFNKAILLDPKYALAHYNLGCATESLGDPEAAADCYEESLRLDPAYASTQFNLAGIWQARGNYMRALQHWLTYIKLDPSGKWADAARKEISRLIDKVVIVGGRAA